MRLDYPCVEAPRPNAWTLTASQRMPAQALYAALLEPRPVAELEPGPQHRLHLLLTAHGFTAYPWRQIELGGSGVPHLADVYLRETPGALVPATRDIAPCAMALADALGRCAGPRPRQQTAECE